jgi:hypothetical protein
MFFPTNRAKDIPFNVFQLIPSYNRHSKWFFIIKSKKLFMRSSDYVSNVHESNRQNQGLKKKAKTHKRLIYKNLKESVNKVYRLMEKNQYTTEEKNGYSAKTNYSNGVSMLETTFLTKGKRFFKPVFLY